MMGAHRIPVLLPRPFEGPLDYLAPEGPPIPPGTWVETRIMGQRSIGVVWDEPSSEEGRPPESKLKPMLSLPPRREHLVYGIPFAGRKEFLLAKL